LLLPLALTHWLAVAEGLGRGQAVAGEEGEGGAEWLLLSGAGGREVVVELMEKGRGWPGAGMEAQGCAAAGAGSGTEGGTGRVSEAGGGVGGRGGAGGGASAAPYPPPSLPP
jgi:hypothetical protein